MHFYHPRDTKSAYLKRILTARKSKSDRKLMNFHKTRVLIFRDLNLGEVCTEICIDVMIDCINNCSDDDCKRQCARDEAICVDGKLLSQK